jgi:hypothetical protein
MTVGTRMIGGGYLRAIRAPLLMGSWCPALTMDFARPHEAMVNKRFLEMYAPTGNLVGGSIRVLVGPGVPLTIVGVVGDLAEDGQATTASPFVYTCDSAGAWPDPEYVVRTADASAFQSDLRRVVSELDPSRAIFGLRPLQAVLDAALDRPRLNATMLGVFASAAVTLAAIGLYSLFMLVVSERSREMAVMLAIGAEPRQMIRLVLSGAGRLLACGLALGVGLMAAAAAPSAAALRRDGDRRPRALALAAGTLAIVSLLAVAGPRSSRADRSAGRVEGGQGRRAGGRAGRGQEGTGRAPDHTELCVIPSRPSGPPAPVRCTALFVVSLRHRRPLCCCEAIVALLLATPAMRTSSDRGEESRRRRRRKSVRRCRPVRGCRNDHFAIDPKLGQRSSGHRAPERRRPGGSRRTSYLIKPGSSRRNGTVL